MCEAIADNHRRIPGTTRSLRALAEDRPRSDAASYIVALLFSKLRLFEQCRLKTAQRYTSRLNAIALQKRPIDEFRCTGELRAVEKLFLEYALHS